MDKSDRLSATGARSRRPEPTAVTRDLIPLAPGKPLRLDGERIRLGEADFFKAAEHRA
jgi:hypothetical protein